MSSNIVKLNIVLGISGVSWGVALVAFTKFILNPWHVAL